MIKQIGIIALVAVGIGALFLGTSHTAAFAAVPPGCTGNPHGVIDNPSHGNPHDFKGDQGNPHDSSIGAGDICPGSTTH